MYEHDLTKLFAGIASRARRLFGVKGEQIHVDTTSFAVSGEYRREAAETEAAVIAITSGYSRDHREDLKQWMLARASTHEGDIPLFMQQLDGTNLDKASLLAAITAIQSQLRETDGEASVSVADNGVYSEANMRQLNQAGVKWVSRVSETLTEAKGLLEEGSEREPQSADGMAHWFSREMTLREAPRTVGGRVHPGVRRACPTDDATPGEQSAKQVGACRAGISPTGALDVAQTRAPLWSAN